MDKLPSPAEVFTALQRAFLCLADPAVAGSGSTSASFGSGGSDSSRGSTAATAAALGRSAEADRLTIARAMAAVYSAHAGGIGEQLPPVDARVLSTMRKPPCNSAGADMLTTARAMAAVHSVFAKPSASRSGPPWYSSCHCGSRVLLASGLTR